MKEKFEKTEIEVIRFEEDVITDSNGHPTGILDGEWTVEEVDL